MKVRHFQFCPHPCLFYCFWYDEPNMCCEEPIILCLCRLLVGFSVTFVEPFINFALLNHCLSHSVSCHTTTLHDPTSRCTAGVRMFDAISHEARDVVLLRCLWILPGILWIYLKCQSDEVSRTGRAQPWTGMSLFSFRAPLEGLKRAGLVSGGENRGGFPGNLCIDG